MNEQLEMQARVIERQAEKIKFLEEQLKDAITSLQDLKYQLIQKYGESQN